MAANDTLDILRRFAPGTPLRDAIDLIIHQRTGAIIVIGTGPVVDQLSAGGFRVTDATFTPQRIAELAKMDGGIVVDSQANHILRANVHFVPDPTIETQETGTRHRTAERLARQTGKPVLAVSEGRRMAIVYLGESKFQLELPTALLAQANQVLNALERLRRRLSDAEDHLTRFEVDDVVVSRDVALVLQRANLVRRLDADLDRLVAALGGEGELIKLQANDILEGVDDTIRNVYADYVKRRPRRLDKIFDLLDDLPEDGLYDAAAIASVLGLGPADSPARPRGLRILSKVPRLPEPVRDSLVSHFGDFQKLLHAEVGELDQVDGVGPTRAMMLRSYFDRLSEYSPTFDLG